MHCALCCHCGGAVRGDCRRAAAVDSGASSPGFRGSKMPCYARIHSVRRSGHPLTCGPIWTENEEGLLRPDPISRRLRSTPPSRSRHGSSLLLQPFAAIVGDLPVDVGMADDGRSCASARQLGRRRRISPKPCRQFGNRRGMRRYAAQSQHISPHISSCTRRRTRRRIPRPRHRRQWTNWRTAALRCRHRSWRRPTCRRKRGSHHRKSASNSLILASTTATRRGMVSRQMAVPIERLVSGKYCPMV